MQAVRLFLALLAPRLCTGISETSGLSRSLAENRNFPVSKVVTLLKNMADQLVADADEDEKTYNKMSCWCETNDKAKTKSIKDTEMTITRYESDSEELTASVARLDTEISGLKADLEESLNARDSATMMREKASEEFTQEERDMVSAINALHAAVSVIGKHHPESPQLLQQETTGKINEVTLRVQGVLARYPHLTNSLGEHTPKLANFLQGQTQNKEPASSEIYGVLTQMQESFQKNLKSMQSHEQSAQKSYDELQAAKTEEIDSFQQQLSVKKTQRVNDDQKNEERKQQVSDLKAEAEADTAFLNMLKEKCQDTDQEWAQRQKARQEEQAALAKAIAILDAESSHAVFKRTYETSFIQVKQSRSGSTRQRIRRSDNSDAKLHPQTKASMENVLKIVENMVKRAKTRKAADIKKRDAWIAENNQNILDINANIAEINSLRDNLDQLASEAADLKANIQSEKDSIEYNNKELKKSGEAREKERVEFEKTTNDQIETQRILKQALKVLDDQFGKAVLVSVSQHDAGAQASDARQPAPAGFKTYKEAPGSNVQLMIQGIIRDTVDMQEDVEKAEKVAQESYEDLVKSLNDDNARRNNIIAHCEEDLAKRESAIEAAKEDMKEAQVKKHLLEVVEERLAKIKGEFIDKFETTQLAYETDIENMRQAIIKIELVLGKSID